MVFRNNFKQEDKHFMKSYIILENLKIYAHHGVLKQETRVGQYFLLNIKIETDNLGACQTDELSQTINYAEIFDVVKNEMKIPSKLIENAAWRIINSLKNKFKQIVSIELRLDKLSPPIDAFDGTAGVLLIG